MHFVRFFFWGGFPTEIYKKEKGGTLILTSLLEDLADCQGKLCAASKAILADPALADSSDAGDKFASESRA